MSIVYGTPATEDRAAYWHHLNTVGIGRDEPWLLTGDFNDILNNAEKIGGPARPEGSFSTFRSFVAQNGLWDLNYTGEQLSWRGNRHTHFIRSRLERSMSNCAWAEAFPMGRCRYLSSKDRIIGLCYLSSTPTDPRKKVCSALTDHLRRRRR